MLFRRPLHLGASLHQRLLAIVVTAGLVAAGTAVVMSARPHADQPQDFHGRTWLTTSAGDHDQLVLVNGLSGLIEGQALGGAAVVPGSRFIDSTATGTLLGSADGITVVDTGTQQAVTREGIDGARTALANHFVLDLGERAQVLPVRLDRPPHRLSGAPVPVGDVAPVVDGEGEAWYLGRANGGRVAVRVAGTTPSVDRFAVDSTTDRLLVVDGHVYAAGPKAIARVDGRGSRTVPASADALPSVAVDSGSLWASASGQSLTVYRGRQEHPAQANGTVTDLALWHGSVVAATDRGAEVLDPSGRLTPIAGITAAASIHADGGLLWLTSHNDVVAIDRDGQIVRFQLAAINANLCVESCNPGDLAQLLEKEPQPASQSDEATPPRELTPPPTDPKLPTTTTTTTPTTAPRRVAGPPRPEPNPQRSTATTTTPKTPPTTSAPAPSQPSPLPTNPTLPPPDNPLSSQPPQTLQSETVGPHIPPGHQQQNNPWVPPGHPQQFPTPSQDHPQQFPTPSQDHPQQFPTPSQDHPQQFPTPSQDHPQQFPTPSQDHSQQFPTPSQGHPQPNQSSEITPVIQITPGDGVAKATVSLKGSPADCQGANGLTALGTVTWSGAGAGGSAPIAVSWPSPDATTATAAARVQMSNLSSGTLEVTLEICGLRSSTATPIHVTGSTQPTFGGITVSPTKSPKVGQSFSATVTYHLPSGWAATSAAWQSDAASCALNGQSSPGPGSASQKFDATSAGPCQLSVVVTFTQPGGGQSSLSPTNPADVTVQSTTTTSSTPAPASSSGSGSPTANATAPKP